MRPIRNMPASPLPEPPTPAGYLVASIGIVALSTLAIAGKGLIVLERRSTLWRRALQESRHSVRRWVARH